MNITQLIATFHNLPKNKKLGLVGLGGIILLTTLGLVLWLLTPHYDVLFNQLDSADARRIVQQLESKKVPYKLTQGGTAILVEPSQVDSLRLGLMGNGLQLSSAVGFELFDRSDFGMTDFSQKINFQRALQGELERTITSLSEIRAARVHLVMPEKHLFESSRPPSAAVTLHFKPGQTLPNKSIQSIQRLIAASVPNMSSAQVVVIDEQGKTLSGRDADPVDARFKAKKNMEQYLREKAQKLLQSVFPQQPVQVDVDVRLNFDQSEKSSESFLPGSNGVVTHSKEVKHVKGDRKSREIDDLSSEKSYQYGRLVEKNQTAVGNIRQLSISVIVPRDTSSSTQAQIARMVENAVGFDTHRGDTISVQALTVAKPQPIESSIAQIALPANRPEGAPAWLVRLWLALAALLVALAVKIVLDGRRRNRLLQDVFACLEQHDASA